MVVSWSFFNFFSILKRLHLSYKKFYKIDNVNFDETIKRINFTFWSFLKDKMKSFLVLTKSSLISLKNKLLSVLTFNTDFYFARVKLKGLGFRVKRYGRFLFRLFLGFNHFFYVHLPEFIYIKSRKKKLIFLSRYKILLFIFFWQVMEVKKLIIYFKGSKAKGFFNKRSFRFVKKLKSFGN